MVDPIRQTTRQTARSTFQRDIDILAQSSSRRKDFRRRIKRARDEGIISVRESKEFLKGRRPKLGPGQQTRQKIRVGKQIEVQPTAAALITEQTPTGKKTFKGKETTITGRKFFVGARQVSKQERAVQSSREFLRQPAAPMAPPMPSSFIFDSQTPFEVKQALPIFALQQRLSGGALLISRDKPTPQPTQKRGKLALLTAEETPRDTAAVLAGIDKPPIVAGFDIGKKKVDTRGKTGLAGLLSRASGTAAIREKGRFQVTKEQFEIREAKFLQTDPSKTQRFLFGAEKGAKLAFAEKPEFFILAPAIGFAAGVGVAGVGSVSALAGAGLKLGGAGLLGATIFKTGLDISKEKSFIEKGAIFAPPAILTFGGIVGGIGGAKAARDVGIIPKPLNIKQTTKNFFGRTKVNVKLKIDQAKFAAELKSKGLSFQEFQKQQVDKALINLKNTKPAFKLGKTQLQVIDITVDKAGKPTVAVKVVDLALGKEARFGGGRFHQETILKPTTSTFIKPISTTIKTQRSIYTPRFLRFITGTKTSQIQTPILDTKPNRLLLGFQSVAQKAKTETIAAGGVSSLLSSSLLTDFKVSQRPASSFNVISAQTPQFDLKPSQRTKPKQKQDLIGLTIPGFGPIVQLPTPSPTPPEPEKPKEIIFDLPGFGLPSGKKRKKKGKDFNFMFKQEKFFTPSAFAQVFNIKVPKSSFKGISKKIFSGFEVRPGVL